MPDKGKGREEAPRENHPRSRSLMRCYKYHDRLFGEHKRGQWLFPVDDTERDRLDILNIAITMARDNSLVEAPVDLGADDHQGGPNGLNGTHTTKRVPQVLDLGTGTGAWVKSMAKKYPQTIFCGVDLYDTFIPNFLTPRSSFAGWIDIESPWDPLYEFFDKVSTEIHQAEAHPPIDKMNWDLIRASMLNGGIARWEDVYVKILNHLRPGTGYVELVEIDWTTRWEDDGSERPAESCSVERWVEELYRIMDEHGRSMRVNPNTKEVLERIGFTDVREKRIKLPMKPWRMPVDDHTDKMVRWFNLAYCTGLQSLMMGPFMQKMGLSESELAERVDRIKYDACRLEWHTYCVLHIWTARRPAPGEVTKGQ